MSIRTLGFILHRFPFQEADLILKLLTPNHGIVSVLAKGAKRSKTQGYFEPFRLMEIEFFGRTELKKIKSLEPVHTVIHGFSFQGDRLFSGFYLNELLTYLVPPSYSSGANLVLLFQHYQKALEKLTQEEIPAEVILREFEIELFKTLGLWPDLSRDHVGQAVDPESFYSLYAEAVPKRVEVSESVEEGIARGYFQGQELLKIVGYDWSDKKTRAAAKRLLRHWVSFYCEGKVFKSRECF